MKRHSYIPILILLIAACAGSPTPEPTPEEATPVVAAAEPTAEPTPTPRPPEADAPDAHREARLRMVERTIAARGVEDPDVLAAMRAVPRHEFVPSEYVNQAYEDHPLPIGYGQTISQPYIVAWMTELLALEPGDRVLEIGTGSGYQAAVLAEMEGVEVYTIEIVPELAEQAAERLQRLGYENIEVKEGDGYYGWPEHAPYDAIIVTAAPDHLPQPLAEQLRDGGRLVIPMGPPGGFQTLWRFTKENGELLTQNLGGVRFVPFTGEGIEQP